MRPLSSRLQDPYGWTLSKSAGSDPRTKLGPRRYQQTSPRSHYYLPRQLQTNNSFIGSVGPNLTNYNSQVPDPSPTDTPKVSYKVSYYSTPGNQTPRKILISPHEILCRDPNGKNVQFPTVLY